jgi:hypothetical protein
MKDREQIVEMLTTVKDQFSLSVYKKAYNISDVEIAEKRKQLNQLSKNNKNEGRT